METDVLIVGAGPTGLMLANQLVRQRVRVTIVDRHAGPARETRALGVQARSLEIYQKLGIVDRALELGKRGLGANIWAQGRHIARVPLGDVGGDVTPYPFILILGQDDNERIMGDKLRELGVSVQWNTELVALEQGPDSVAVTLKMPDASMRQATVPWVAGCDGAHSAVRTMNDITFPGAPYEHVFFVADTVATGTMYPDEVNVYLWREGFHLLFPMRGRDHWRVVGILPPVVRGRAEVSFEDVIPSLRHEAGAALSFASCSWFSTYRIHHRVASRFRDRRCFLLGDAAHIHSPVGAQGMNTGLQDAYNLGWKLALVVKDRSEAELLDSYEDERVPVAMRLLHTTDRAFRLIVSDNWLAALLRTKVIARIAAFAMARKEIRAIAFRIVSQTGVRYRNSPLSQSLEALPEAAPQAGDRFPWLRLKLHANGPVEDLFAKLDDTHFHLIVASEQAFPLGAIPLDSDLFRLHVIPDDPANEAELARAKIPWPSFYLVRPDGYVGLCGVHFDANALRQYLSERLELTV